MQSGGESTPAGALGIRVIRAAEAREIRERFDQLVSGAHWPAKELSVRDIAHYGLPRRGLDERVNRWRARNARHLWRGVRRVMAARALRLPTLYGSLYLTRISREGEPLDLGLASMRVVTTAGAAYLVDALQNLAEPELMRYHGIGTGTAAESAADVGLQTEATTALNPDSTRATGSLTEAASTIFRTIGTNLVDSAVAVTEHGIFSAAATGTGVLLDRSVFAVVNLLPGDSLQTTYDFTITPGG